MTRVGVVGHVEWVSFAALDELPASGAIVHTRDAFDVAGGGGAVAAVALARLTGAGALLLCALGEDAHGDWAARQLCELGVELHAARRPRAQRRALTLTDAAGERTIVVLGERLVPRGDDPLPWDRLAELDGIYFTGGDAAALRAARRARVLVATARALDAIAVAGVRLDVLIASASDPGERLDLERIDPPPRLVVLTEGARGGRWWAPEGIGRPDVPGGAGAAAPGATSACGRWAAASLPGEPVDAYGCGDVFAAALCLGLAAGRSLDAALAHAAACGAAVRCGRGPYGAELPAPHA